MNLPERPKRKIGGSTRLYGTEWPVYDSMEQMSGASGIPLDLLKKSKKEGCLFVRHGKCHAGVWVQWFFNRQMEGDQVHDWPTRDKAATAMIKETKLEILRRSVVEFEHVDKFLRFLVGQVFFGEMERIRFEFPVMLKGRSEVEIAKLVGDRLDKLAEDFKSRVRDWKIESKTKYNKKDDE